jgi:phosphohistidine phosphatase SixA
VAHYLIRHAKAGSRGKWNGVDEERPLTAIGLAQARALADRLQKVDPPRLLSSPYVRCVQTLEPLAERLGVPIEPHPALAEGAPVEPVLVMLDELPDGSVLCSHGDVIPDTIDALLGRGLVIDGQPDWRKGSLWVIEPDGDGSLRARAEPPPV